VRHVALNEVLFGKCFSLVRYVHRLGICVVMGLSIGRYMIQLPPDRFHDIAPLGSIRFPNFSCC